MAILYHAELRPSKLELVAQWLPSRPWYDGPAVPRVQRVASFRFDDPDGEVGVETHLVQVDDGPMLQVPFTYRDAPLPSADGHLVGTMDHSVLGRRWVYDGCADPVYARCRAETILGGGHEAEQFYEVDGALEPEPGTARVTGTGDGTRSAEDLPTAALEPATQGVETSVVAGPFVLRVLRVPTGEAVGDLALGGTWPGVRTPVALAFLSAA